MLRRLYDWVLSWADSPYGPWALAALAFCESSFFPIPPDALLLALAFSAPRRAFGFAAICSIGSVLGGAFGYLLGIQFMEAVGRSIIAFYGAEERFTELGTLYNRYDAWAVGIAGFTPLPYKVFTIAAGAFRIDFGIFMLASAASRSARFFLEGLLVYAWGQRARALIERHFNLATALFMVLLVLGFMALRWAAP